MATVFISRDLQVDSIFKKILTQNGCSIVGRSLIQLQPISFDDVPVADWIFFYSKNAVRFFFQQANRIPTFYRHNYKYATIGAATASALRDFYTNPSFVGDGHPNSTANSFLKTYQPTETVIFPRAKHSKQSIQKILRQKIQALDLLVYDNQPTIQVKAQSEDFLVFTSPMNVRAYFARHFLLPHQRIIAIGNTTASELLRLNIVEITIADAPNESALASAVLKLSINS